MSTLSPLLFTHTSKRRRRWPSKANVARKQLQEHSEESEKVRKAIEMRAMSERGDEVWGRAWGVTSRTNTAIVRRAYNALS